MKKLRDKVCVVTGASRGVGRGNDPAVAGKLDAACRAKYQMPLMVMPDSVAYCVRPRVVLAWTEAGFPTTATRWEFPR